MENNDNQDEVNYETVYQEESINETSIFQKERVPPNKNFVDCRTARRKNKSIFVFILIFSYYLYNKYIILCI